MSILVHYIHCFGRADARVRRVVSPAKINPMSKNVVPEWFLPMIMGVLISLQAWALVEIVNLKVAVAQISAKIAITSEIAQK